MARVETGPPVPNLIGLQLGRSCGVDSELIGGTPSTTSVEHRVARLSCPVMQNRVSNVEEADLIAGASWATLANWARHPLARGKAGLCYLGAVVGMVASVCYNTYFSTCCVSYGSCAVAGQLP